MKFKKNAVYIITSWGNEKPITWCFNNTLIFNGKWFEDTYWAYQPTQFNLCDVKEFKLKRICDDITKMKEVDPNEFRLYKQSDKLQIMNRGSWSYLVKKEAKVSVKLFKNLVKRRINKVIHEIEYYKNDLEKWEEILTKVKNGDMSVLNVYIAI